jgi:hypothetical protein
MLPRKHIIIGILFVIAIYFLFPTITLFSLLIIFSSSVLIDVDHYFYYILRRKDFNFIRCYKWYKENRKKVLSLPMNERKKRYSGFYMLHGIELIIILLVLGFYINSLFFFISIGFLLHFLVDTPNEFYEKRTMDKSSLIYNFYRFRKLRKS